MRSMTERGVECTSDQGCLTPVPLCGFGKFKYALAYLLRGARHALHDILLLRTSAIRRRLYLGRRLDSHQDEFALLATYRGGSLIYFQGNFTLSFFWL